MSIMKLSIMKLVEYNIIRAFTPGELSEEVTLAITAGWQPYGQFAMVTRSDGATEYAQPMGFWKEVP